MAGHVRLKNELTEDEKCHNLICWLISAICNVYFQDSYNSRCVPIFSCPWFKSLFIMEIIFLIHLHLQQGDKQLLKNAIHVPLNSFSVAAAHWIVTLTSSIDYQIYKSLEKMKDVKGFKMNNNNGAYAYKIHSESYGPRQANLVLIA